MLDSWPPNRGPVGRTTRGVVCGARGAGRCAADSIGPKRTPSCVAAGSVRGSANREPVRRGVVGHQSAGRLRDARLDLAPLRLARRGHRGHSLVGLLDDPIRGRTRYWHSMNPRSVVGRHPYADTADLARRHPLNGTRVLREDRSVRRPRQRALPPCRTFALLNLPASACSAQPGRTSVGFSGARLAAARRNAGLTQDQLGRAVGVGQARVSDWERGATTPRPEVVPRIAAALSLKALEFLAPDLEAAALEDLRLAAGRSHQTVADELGISRRGTERWRRVRPGAPRRTA
jgi:DNA-binding XRE family transcriptional regulator